jgi:hypothetical protein
MSITVLRRSAVLEALWPEQPRVLTRAAPGARDLARSALAKPPAAIQRLASAPSENQLSARLDDLMKRMSGPYVVNGQKVRVPAAFQTLYGQKDVRPALSGIRRAVGSERFKAIAMNAARAVGTRGRPEDVTKTVQSLIDAGALKEFPLLSTEKAIVQVMLKYEIGFDCRGFVYRAFLYSRGSADKEAKAARFNLADPGNFDFARTGGALRRVAIESARAGDVIRLLPLDGRDHNVIVRSSRRLTRDAEQLEIHGKTLPVSFARVGQKLQVLEVDSSWGGGSVERRVWVKNENSGRWAFWEDGKLRVTPGPYAHELDGVFRPKGE